MKHYLLLLIAAAFVAGCGRARSGPISVGGRAVADWARDARSNDPRVRAFAVSKLGNVGSNEPKALRVVLIALDDPDPRVRRASIVALPKFGAAAKALASDRLDAIARTDRDPSVRKLAERSREKSR